MIGLEQLKQDLVTIENLVEYIVSYFDVNKQKQVCVFYEQYELRMFLEDGRRGILFTGQLADMRLGLTIKM